MVHLFAVTLVGLVLDPRSITDAPAWLKPSKFAASAKPTPISMLGCSQTSCVRMLRRGRP
jgi:hypothetical protein